jgi:hypothetical protein
VTLGCVYKVWLLRLKLRAMRTGTWFRALPRIDRVLLEGLGSWEKNSE